MSPAPTALLLDALRAGGIWRDVPAAEVPVRLADAARRLPGADAGVTDLLAQLVHAPGALHWALVGDGLALPHVRLPVPLGRDLGVLAILLLREPLAVPEEPPDGRPVRTVLFFVAPTPQAHLAMISQLSHHLLRGRLKHLLAAGAPDAEIQAALAAPPADRAQ